MLELPRLISSLAGSEGRGIDTLDPRFQDIATLVEQAEFAKAAEQCQETFSEGPDLRLISWFFYGLFLQDGMKALTPMFKAGAAIFRDSFAAVGPTKKKDHHATAGMAWFLGKLADRVVGEGPERAAEAQRLKGTTNLEQVSGALDALDELGAAFAGAVPANPPKVTDPLRKVREWLDGLKTELTPPPVTEAAPAAAAAEASDVPTNGDAPRPAPSLSGAPSVEASFRMVELQARIAAFERLVNKNEMAKAALVAADILGVIDHFDPRLYLPRLFSGFFVSFARRTNDLLAFQAKKGSVPWRIYDQLYRTDLDAFVHSRDEDFQSMLAAVEVAHVAAPGAQPASGEESAPPPAPPPPAPPPPAPAASSDDW